MLSVAPAPAWHHTTCELINNHSFTIAHDVIHIPDKQLLGLQCIGDVMGPGISGVKQIPHFEVLLSLGKAFICECATALLLINLVVTLRVNAILTLFGSPLKSSGHICSLLILLLGTLHLSGNDQGSTRLIDQDRIHLIDDAVLKLPLNHLTQIGGHVVTQVVKTQL
ncbi:MAG: Uncharacterised protein [Prochlorococcus marinus str. MIT 9313]|nr:MAG: Uncharacterised protein [Prochlorococcus marinus str. MIT 9313]